MFSIIVPCYNVSERIDALFDMLSGKDYTDYEVILVDDCSKDDTFEKLTAKCKEYENFKAYQTSKNGGPGLARNFGLSKSLGEYILFCDSDDLFDISCLAKIEEFIKKNADTDMLVFSYNVVRGGNSTHADTYSRYSSGEHVKPEDVVTGNGAPWAKVYKKSIIDENKLEFPARMTGEDVCFVVNYTVFAQNIYKLDIAYYSYVMNDSSITHSHRADWRIPTTFELLLPIYEEHFPSVILGQFIEGHLLTRAKLMTDARCKNSEIKQWFKEENKRYPDWYDYTVNLDRSIYRRMIYFAMRKSSPILIKLVMLIRRILY